MTSGAVMPSAHEVVDLGPDDVDDVDAIEQATFGSDAWSRSALADELSAPHRRYLGVRDSGGVLVAYAGLLSPAGSQDGDIQTIAVRADQRGAGLGRLMMDALIAEAAARGNDALFLEVRRDNPVAIALYTSLGFVLIGERPRYYQPDGVDALVMRKNLKEEG